MDRRTPAKGGDVIQGGCQCGAVRYELIAAPRTAYACHCNECRRQSASAFGISIIIDRDGLRILKGDTRVWTRPTDSGSTMDCHFCPTCGTRLWHFAKGDPDTISVKGGSLDAPPDFATLHHIWVSQKLPGVVLPDGVLCFDEAPHD